MHLNFDFRLLASRTVRKYISVVQPTQCVIFVRATLGNKHTSRVHCPREERRPQKDSQPAVLRVGWRTDAAEAQRLRTEQELMG